MFKLLLEFREYLSPHSIDHDSIPTVLIDIIHGYYLDLSLSEPLKKQITEYKHTQYRWIKLTELQESVGFISYSHPFSLVKINYTLSNESFPLSILTENDFLVMSRAVWVYNDYYSKKQRRGQYSICDFCNEWHDSNNKCE